MDHFRAVWSSIHLVQQRWTWAADILPSFLIAVPNVPANPSSFSLCQLHTILSIIHSKSYAGRVYCLASVRPSVCPVDILTMTHQVRQAASVHFGPTIRRTDNTCYYAVVGLINGSTKHSPRNVYSEFLELSIKGHFLLKFKCHNLLMSVR